MAYGEAYCGGIRPVGRMPPVSLDMMAADVLLQQTKRRAHADANLGRASRIGFELNQSTIHRLVGGEQARRAVDHHISTQLLQFRQR
jgi:hypothetical protein